MARGRLDGGNVSEISSVESCGVEFAMVSSWRMDLIVWNVIRFERNRGGEVACV